MPGLLVGFVTRETLRTQLGFKRIVPLAASPAHHVQLTNFLLGGSQIKRRMAGKHFKRTQEAGPALGRGRVLWYARPHRHKMFRTQLGFKNP